MNSTEFACSIAEEALTRPAEAAAAAAAAEFPLEAADAAAAACKTSLHAS